MQEVLDELGIGPDSLDEQHSADLDRAGYCRFDAFAGTGLIAALLPLITDALRGRRQGGTLHLKGLLEMAAFDALWLRPALLAAVAHLLGPDFRIGEMHYRAGTPGHGGQALHMDASERGRPGQWRVGNAIVALTDFTTTNGATRVVPGSHLDHRFQPPVGHGAHPDEVLLTGPAGTCWLFNSHLWHSGTRNRSDQPRHAVLIAFTRRNSGPIIGPETMPSHETVLRLGNAAYLLM